MARKIVIPKDPLIMNIRVKKETWFRMRKVGEFGETYDDLINRLIDFNLSKVKK